MHTNLKLGKLFLTIPALAATIPSAAPVPVFAYPADTSTVTLDTGDCRVCLLPATRLQSSQTLTWNIYQLARVDDSNTLSISSDAMEALCKVLELDSNTPEQALLEILSNNPETIQKSVLEFGSLMAEKSPKYTVTVRMDPSTGTLMEGLEEGWYLFEGSGHSPILVRADSRSESTIILKEELPSLTKTVQENSTKSWQSYGDFKSGETIPFRYTANLPSFDWNNMNQLWRIEDRFSEMLEVHDDFQCVLHTADDNDSKYPLKIGSIARKSSSVVLDLDLSGEIRGWFQEGSLSEKDLIGAWIEITYSGEIVADDSSIFEKTGGASAYKNSARLSWSYDGQHWNESADSTTRTYTYGLDLLKTDTSETRLLPDAEFSIQDESNDQWLKFDVLEDGNYIVSMDEGSVDHVVTNDKGEVHIAGLDAGMYRLVETKAPEGFEIIDREIELSVEMEEEETLRYQAAGQYESIKLTNRMIYADAAVSDRLAETLSASLIVKNQQQGLPISNPKNPATKAPGVNTAAHAETMIAGLVFSVLLFLLLGTKKKNEQDKQPN